MRTLRSILDDAALGMLSDIIRTYFTDPDLGETTLYRVLDLDVDDPSIDLLLTRDIAGWIYDGIVKPGFMTSLWNFLFDCGAMSNTNGRPVMPDFDVLEPGTDVHDFFMWLGLKPRTISEAYMRWPKDTSDRLWNYFKADRLRQHGYAVSIVQRGTEEVMGIVKCRNT